jgi:hypothetical protein
LRVSQYFKLNLTQPYLDFVDVTLNTDVPAFVDPGAIRRLPSEWGHRCTSLLQQYFENVIECIKANRHDEARQLLSCLSERNEFHLGLSKGRSQGHAFGDKSARAVWNALKGSKAAKSGLLQDLEDTCLLIDGIGRDMISDAVCNIIRGPLIEYTQQMCREHGIETTIGVQSGPIWNQGERRFESTLLRLPLTTFGPVIFIPKQIVRYDVTFKADEYYRHYLLPEMQKFEIARNSSLVKVLKSKRKRVTKKSLIQAYGKGKTAASEQTINHPEALDRYRKDKRKKANPPLLHSELVDIGGSAPPDYEQLVAELANLPTGNAAAGDYEKLVRSVLVALFYPALTYPIAQHEIHNGRKRIDISFTNEATSGFFFWLAEKYNAPYVYVECKNYGKEIGNPEYDQLSGRFSTRRGTFGLLVCRSVEDRKKVSLSCRDTAADGRGFIIVLDDDDLAVLLREAASDVLRTPSYELLRTRFLELVS